MTAELNDVTPSSLSHLIGQRNVMEQVEVALDAAHTDGRSLDHALLVGPPGLGKSALANVLACEMATGFHEVLGQTLNSPEELDALLLGAKDRDVVFIDEAHEMKKQFQVGPYLALDKRKLFISNGKGDPQGIPVANFTLLLATTDEFCLLQPLRDRKKLVLHYEFYSQEELVEQLRRRSAVLQWDVFEEAFSSIASRSRGTPRLALRLLQSCHRVARSLGDNSISGSHLQRACELEQLDDLGLGPNEQAYLRILEAGPARLNVLVSTLSLPPRTVSQVVESFLIRAGLIFKDKRGKNVNMVSTTRLNSIIRVTFSIP